MATLTEGARNGEAIAYVVHPEYCFDQVTYASGNNFAACQVVKGPDTAIIPAVAADTTGLFLSNEAVNATSAAKKGSILKRGPAVVNGNLVTYPAGTTAPQKVAINTALAAVGIVVRV
jgi:Bacteriophage lambda head decoration protein D